MLSPGGLIIAGRIIMHGPGIIAAGSAIGAGEISDAIGKIGIGIAQSLGIAGVAEAPRGGELDLHQADGAAASDQTRAIAAFLHDDAMYQTFRHMVGIGMSANESVELGMSGDLGMSGLDACWRAKCCRGDKPRQR